MPWWLNEYHLLKHLNSSCQIVLVVKIPPANTGDTTEVGSTPGLGRCPRVGNGNPLWYFAWRIPWTEEPGELQSIGSQSMWLKRLSTSEAGVLCCQGFSLVDHFSLFCLCRKSNYVIYCCVINYPTTQCLQIISVYYLSFCGSGIWVQLRWVL